MFPLQDVLVIVFGLDVDVFVQDLKKQKWRFLCVGKLEQFQSLVKRAHLQLDLEVLDKGNSHFEQVDLAFQQKPVPDPEQKVSLEHSWKDWQEPGDQVKLGL